MNNFSSIGKVYSEMGKKYKFDITQLYYASTKENEVISSLIVDTGILNGICNFANCLATELNATYVPIKEYMPDIAIRNHRVCLDNDDSWFKDLIFGLKYDMMRICIGDVDISTDYSKKILRAFMDLSDDDNDSLFIIDGLYACKPAEISLAIRSIRELFAVSSFANVRKNKVIIVCDEYTQDILYNTYDIFPIDAISIELMPNAFEKHDNDKV